MSKHQMFFAGPSEDEVRMCGCAAPHARTHIGTSPRSLPSVPPLPFRPHPSPIVAVSPDLCIYGCIIHLDEGVAKAREKYPDGLCNAICQELREQKAEDTRGLVKITVLSMVQLKQVLSDYGCPEHWVDGQHEDNSSDRIMSKELFKLGVKLGTS